MELIILIFLAISIPVLFFTDLSVKIKMKKFEKDMAICSKCGSVINTPQQKPEPFTVTHTVNHIQHISKVVPYNDAFYEIVEGKWKGNLVHIFNAKRF